MDANKEAAKLRDWRAEMAVVCGAIREPEEVMPALADMGVTEADFTCAKCEAAIRTARGMWLRGTLVNVVTISYSMSAERAIFGSHLSLAKWLLRAHSSNWWPDDIASWWQKDCGHICASVALAAAARVKWLSERRALIYNATEVIRDALSPTDGPGNAGKHFKKLRPDGGGELF